MKRDFTYVDDVVEGVVRVIDRIPQTGEPATTAPYQVYNIGNNQPVELMKLIETIENSLGKKAVKEMLPMQPGDVPRTYADVDALMNDVDFRPDTPIEVGIDKFVAWYRGYYGV